MSTSATQAQELGIAKKFAAYIDGMKTKNLDPETRLQAIRCVFDLVIAVAAGAHESGPTATRQTALDLYKFGNVPIWFSDSTSSAIGAAFANSASAAVLDLDDGTRSAKGHAGAAVIPVAFAIGAQEKSTPLQILKAIVIGYEVAVKVGQARKPDDFGYSMTWCIFGVVAAAASLMKLSPDIIEHALGIAGEHIPTHHPVETPRPEGSDCKEGIPWAVVTGLTAISLATNGHTGARNILDIKERYNWPKDLALGKGKAEVFNSYFKLYTNCRYIHSPIDATLNVIEEHGLDVDTIESIKIFTIASCVRLENRTRPNNFTDVAYGTQYSIALAILHGPDALMPLRATSIGREDVSALAEKMEVIQDDDLTAKFPAQTLARVEITANGKVFKSEVTEPKGEATSPLTWDELEEKCRKATRFVATTEQQDSLIASAVTLRDNRDIKPIVNHFKTMVLGSIEQEE